MTRWPQLMKRKTACEYLDMSEGSFEKEILAGRFPSAIKVGGRDHWYKEAIDAAIDRMVNGDPAMPEWRKELYERHGKAA